MSDRTVRPPTLAVVARHAGVSVPTVSKVLRGRSDVAAATRAKVNEVLDALHYPRQEKVAGLSLIDVVLNELNTTWAAKLLAALEFEAREQGLSMVVNSLPDPATRLAPPRRWLENLAGRGSSGVVGVMIELSDAQREYLLSQELPVCIIDGKTQPAGISGVRLLNYEAEHRATRHLIELGHRRIAMVTGAEKNLESARRLEGYRAALEEAGIELDDRLVERGGFTADGAIAATRRLVQCSGRPTAIVYGSDKMALAGYGVLAAQGLRIPDDISVIGFDDTVDCDLAQPPLSTVAQPVAAMAKTAIGILTGSIDSGGGTMFELAAELTLRSSTAPLGRRQAARMSST
ncbi:LacI family DNA-binding transcriptional regulator [Kribbella sp. NPDC005582]|uniref:LacI family DNA-binding transcriptional regulator n=1 Tax=Kribbella sp. NPDC005582 TaxID=3156893 RepID=UPI0033B2EC63